MAYSLLTDPKAINALGPDKSILGTIIRPDPVLLDRKGGDKGELTFDRLLPGAGEPLPLQVANVSGMLLYNWQFMDDDEPLPREILGSWQKKRALKAKDILEKYDDAESSKREPNGSSSREPSAKKKKKNIFHDDDDGYGRSLPRHWNHSR